MNKHDAVDKAKKQIIATFVLNDAAGFHTEDEENDTLIKLGAGEGIPDFSPTDLGVWYLTFGFDSVEGEGDFRVTVRVTEDTTGVVDFEATP